MVSVKECTSEDIALLAEMNKQLIEDEKADNPMDIIQLQDRMAEFLNSGYKAFLFAADENFVGYALCDMTKEPIYLRQFFIKREERRKQYGKTAFEKLLQKLEVNEIDVDVFAWNEAGMKFYEEIGFAEQWKRMRYKSE